MNKDPSAAKKLAEINAAYDVLSDQSKRRAHDRALSQESEGPPTAASPAGQPANTRPPHRPTETPPPGTWGKRASSEDQRQRAKDEAEATFRPRPRQGHSPFFKSAAQAEDAILFTGTIGNELYVRQRIKADLRQLTLGDVIAQTPRYMAWQRELDQATAYSASTLKNLYFANYGQIGAGLKHGFSGSKWAWLSFSAGFLVAEQVWGGLFGSLSILAVSPAFWQTFAFYSTRGELRKATDRIHEFKNNLLAASSVTPLINAVTAYDFMAQTFDRNFKYIPGGAQYERLQRGWMLKLMRNDPVILKGWLLRELQDKQKLGARTFFADLRGRPRFWAQALRDLIADLGNEPELRAKAEQKLAELENQSAFTTAVGFANAKIGWGCELLLANRDALLMDSPPTAAEGNFTARPSATRWSR